MGSVSSSLGIPRCSSFGSEGRIRAMAELRDRDGEGPWGEVQKVHCSRRKSQELETCKVGRGENIEPAPTRTLSNFLKLAKVKRNVQWMGDASRARIS